ncbi:3-hydroxyacyl-CoA dehydrogenase NAD-binding domain-containing protein [Geoalkalibacter halelectricus]|uniref:enoyl-CoA hydratase n=1 Tax=Geoalkalibacter halelectricus TaxID=2847045 RepID=A0ABY5ZP40_9BACT|nr:3-hydroxyacyl-CoA dehydrogenase NAD-binding domain-containing protein [Geoalkalibacter halelectricus]MDO3379152.1 3-hydroxyacyl-CoA dehydrogenase NAD-binding domain-containing protein [Geoalkalibacter halelectricus]UWZ80912.1 3-hydroxyacyl-CoA dehydrogenase NAD-binding domain-containing protein [Geoalkalibacter halelectricus]
MGEFVSYTLSDGIARVAIDAGDSRVNILNGEFLAELEETAGHLNSDNRVRAVVVVSEKKAGFIAGADIRQIAAVTEAAEGERLAREGQRIFETWARLPIPVVAAVHGHCLGGGTEFILACHYRVVSETASIALPEIKLGLFPGFGGTQRLPRLISLEKSLEMILTGRTVSGIEALNLGLADECAPGQDLDQAAESLARQAVRDPRDILKKRRRKSSGLRHWLLEKNPFGRALLFHQAEKRIRARSGSHYPAPYQALEVVRAGLRETLETGLEIEARELGKILLTPVCKNLIRVFELNQRAKKAPGLDAEPLAIERVAVIGGGVMGRGIAGLFAQRGMVVVIRDLQQEIVDQALAQIRAGFERQAAKRHQTAEAVAEKMARLWGTTLAEDLTGSDLVIEAVVEKIPVKQKVLAELEPLLSEKALFVTNTSALSVSELQKSAQRPANIGGLHFFNPAEKMPLVEVIRGADTSEQTLATLFAAALNLGKTPIVVADRPGFLVNRLLMAFLNEACLIVESGVDWLSLDVRATSFGLPMGPFRLLDEVGLDIAADVGATLSGAFAYVEKSSLLERAAGHRHLGRKAGRGFYRYQNDHEIGRNQDLADHLGLPVDSRSARRADLRRMLLLMVNEAARCLEEGVVGAPEDVDTGMIFGTGFPPFLGGPCRWADSLGLPTLVAELENLAAEHGSRFAPADWLRNRERFYG